MKKNCRHEYFEPNVENIVECGDDYILFKIACIHCGEFGFAGGEIGWNPTYWPEEEPENDTQPYKPKPRK